MAAVWSRGQQHTHAHTYTSTPPANSREVAVESGNRWWFAGVSVCSIVGTVLGYGMQNVQQGKGRLRGLDALSNRTEVLHKKHKKF